MRIGKKIEIETLNLKFLVESLEIAELQLKEGTEDLHFRLSHFRKRVANKDILKYDQYFFGKNTENVDSENDSLQKNIVPFLGEGEEITPTYGKQDKWLKTIYRKIVSSTHPDKFANFSVDGLKQKYLNVYRKAVNAWSKGQKDIILIAAYETDIPVENPNALPILRDGNKKNSERLQEIKKLLAYQWYHVPDEKREETLENYLRQIGYEFTKSEIKDVVKLARQRKVGTRPQNFRKKIKKT